MKPKFLIRAILLILLSSVGARCAQESNGTPEELAKKTAKYADRSDYSSIEQLIDTQESGWGASPGTSYFDNMLQIGSALAQNPKQSDERYWIFRKVVWKTLLKSYPPVKDSTEFERVDHAKAQLLFDAVNVVPYVVAANPDMFASIRHDTAMMLMEYARQIRSLIVPGYKEKPVPMNNIAERRRLFQNEIDNALQREMQAALGRLSSRFYLYSIIYAYKQPPRNDEEMFELMNALNIQGSDRAMVLRQVNWATQNSSSPTAAPPASHS